MVDNQTISDAFRAIVGDEHVVVPQHATAVPVWLAHPASATEVAALLGIARKFNLAMAPQGSIVAPRKRNVPTRPTVEISTSRLCHVIGLDERSLMTHVQVGITGAELERQLNPRGLTLGDYPPVILRSSLGGMIAMRTHGKSSARYGFFEDNVVGLSAVLPNGKSVHTRVAPRRATGPDFNGALCGSEGTVGFITSVVLRLHRAPEARFATAYVLPSVDAAVSAVLLALREEATPTGIRIYDTAEARAHFDQLELADGEAVLVAATAGPTDLAACDRDLFESAALAERGRPAPPTIADLWWRRIHGGVVTPTPPATMQLMATSGKLRQVYHAARRGADLAGVSLRTHISRFDADGAVLFFTPILGSEYVTDPDIIDAVTNAAEGAGGFPLGARSLRMDPYLHALRAAIDPLGIMNPEALI